MGGMTADLKEVTAKLLPSRPSTPPLPGGGLTGGGLPGKVPGSKSLRPPTPPFGGAWGGPVPCDVSVLKKRGHGLRTWMVIDSWGHCKMVEADKSTIMRRYRDCACIKCLSASANDAGTCVVEVVLWGRSLVVTFVVLRITGCVCSTRVSRVDGESQGKVKN